MNKPSEEQIEKIKEGLPKHWPYDYYECFWQDPETLEPVGPHNRAKPSSAYLTKLVFKKVMTGRRTFKWELDEGSKIFEEFIAKGSDRMNSNEIEKPNLSDDEYGIADILKRYNAEGALSEISAKFDLFCNHYMSSRENIRTAAFVEANCSLMSAVIECRGDNELLKNKINGLITACNEYTREKNSDDKNK